MIICLYPSVRSMFLSLLSIIHLWSAYHPLLSTIVLYRLHIAHFSIVHHPRVCILWNLKEDDYPRNVGVNLQFNVWINCVSIVSYVFVMYTIYEFGFVIFHLSFHWNSFEFQVMSCIYCICSDDNTWKWTKKRIFDENSFRNFKKMCNEMFWDQRKVWVVARVDSWATVHLNRQS